MADAAAQDDAELDPNTIAAADAGAADDDAQDGAGEAKPNPEAEKVARLMGWKPAEDWEGDKSKCLSAEDFLAKQPEISRNLRRKVDATQDKLNRVVGEVAKLSKNQKQQVSAELKAALTDAVTAGDHETALKIVDQIEKSAGPADAEEVPAFTAFKERNDWFGVDDEATAYVITLDKKFNTDKSGERDPETHFRKIEAAMKKRFPELYGEAKDAKDEKPAARAPLVNRGGRTGGQRNSGELTVADMNASMRKAADEYGVSHAEYVKNYNRYQAEKASA